MKKLWSEISRLIDIPFDPHNEKTNHDNLVSALINLLLIIGFVGLVFLAILRGIRSGIFITAIIFVIISLFARIGVQRGKTIAISYYFLGITWVSLTAMILVFENGLRAPVYIGLQLFLVVYAGLLHGRKAVIVISVLSVGVSVIIAILESKGILLTEPTIPDIRFSIIALSIFVVAIGYMVIKTVENLQRSISLYREESIIRHESEQEVILLNQDLEIAYETTLEGWARALELRDKETEGHSRRVIDLTIKIAKLLDFDDTAIKYVYYGALLHDIGKMGIPDGILNKPGPLTPEEREIVNQHPIYAFEMLKDIEYLKPAISIPYSHHENWDGTGYPQKLQGEEIPLAARIFSVIDNWDALTSDRPYRKAWSKEKTINYLKDQSGKKFDPNLIDLFLNELINIENTL